MKTKSVLLIVVSCLMLGGMVGYFLKDVARLGQGRKKRATTTESPAVHERRAGGYEFINPLLECDNFRPARISSYVKLEDELNLYIRQMYADGRAQHISVYFRDLNNGPWIGINQDEKYAPASLLKVPVAIAAFKKAEAEPEFLKKTVKFSSYQLGNVIPNMNDTACLKLGSSYTIERLIEYAVADSDNEAMMLLLNNVGEDLVTNVMGELGIQKSGSANDFVSVKEYASMFRLLYNATYLNRDKSEALLRIMNKAKYQDGIPAGVPRGVKVSHKFGERAIAGTDQRQLHDCGIVYADGSPYLLCVMTRGTDFGELTSIISHISAMAHSNVIVSKN